MYRAAFRSFRISQLGFLGAFAVCAFTELFYPLGLMPFLLITVFWGLHSLSFLFACKGIKTQNTAGEARCFSGGVIFSSQERFSLSGIYFSMMLLALSLSSSISITT